jgi:hypothetical protein
MAEPVKPIVVLDTNLYVSYLCRTVLPSAPPPPCSLALVPQQRGYTLHEGSVGYRVEVDPAEL